MASIVNRSAFTVTVPGYRGKDKNKYSGFWTVLAGVAFALEAFRGRSRAFCRTSSVR